MIDTIITEEKSVKLHYDKYANVCQEDHFDANGDFVFSIFRKYNEMGLITKEINAVGEETLYVYDQFGRPLSKSNPKETIVYDGRGRIASSSNAFYTSTYKYDARDNLIEMTDEKGTSYYTYYDKKLIKTERDGKVTKASYDLYRRQISATDANGNTTRYEYNARNLPTKITYPDGSVEIKSYFADGKLEWHKAPDDTITRYSYDCFDRVIKKSIDGVGEESFVYDNVKLLSHTDLEGFVTHFTYDALDRKISEERAGRTITYTYDTLSRIKTKTQGNITTTYSYDNLNRVIEESTPYSNVQYTYDALGNKTTTTNGGNTSTTLFDALKRPIKVIDALGNTTTIAYTPFQKITTDARGLITTETFDTHDNLISKEMKGVFSFRYRYDTEGNLIKEEEDVYLNGVITKTLITTYCYNNLNQVTSINKYGEETRYTYALNGKVHTKTKPDGAIITYTYDKLGNLIQANADTFTYNKLGHLTGGRGFSRTLDPFGNTLSETLANGLTIHKTYDDLDRPLTLTLPTGTVHYAYDLNLTALTYKDYTHTYSYDLAGHTLTNGPTTYTRDANGQILTLSSPNLTQECKYDQVGNLIFATPDTFEYDELSQLAFAFDSHYDPPNAPLTGKLEEINNLKLTYDEHDRLISAADTTFTYDALGRRLSKNNELYLYDGEFEIGTLDEGRYYLKISPDLFDLDNTLALVLLDATYTLRYLIDTNHTTLNSYLFDPFGTPISIQETIHSPYQYALKHLDPETTLIYYGKRYYNPSTKRWITQDPAGPLDLHNLYTFSRNNPLRYTDPTGLLSEEETKIMSQSRLSLMWNQGYKRQDTVGTYKLKNRKLYFVPGIETLYCEAREHAKLISNLAGGAEVNIIYNRSYSLPLDLLKSYMTKKGMYTLTCIKIMDEIKEFHKTQPPHMKMEIYNHSAGAIHLKQALWFSRKQERERVISVSFAPGDIITSKNCKKAYTYSSLYDPVVFGSGMIPNILNARHVTFLKPADGASVFSHSFNNPTFRAPLENHLQPYAEEIKNRMSPQSK